MSSGKTSGGMNKQGRPTTPTSTSKSPQTGAQVGPKGLVASNDTTPASLSEVAMQAGPRHRGLELEEALIFEMAREGQTGVDIEPPAHNRRMLGALAAEDEPDLPGLSEPQTVRHYTRLSRKNYGIDMGLFPLGSCTMKHNPRLNEKMARLAGFSDIHPLQPQRTVPGAIDVMQQLSNWLLELTGMAAVALSPKAGAQGELCGMMAIRAALEARGDARSVVLVPESAHGTNPATAAFCGYQVKAIEATADGRVDLEGLKAALGDDVAAIMLTNPNTCGLFERDIIEIADAVHAAGALFYCDGANFNAIVGRVKPGDLGIDAMHINLHKTFSTPHGGGGPGSGPVVFSEALAAYAPIPMLAGAEGQLMLQEQAEGNCADSFGRLTAFHGQMGMYVRALAYMLSFGADGLKQVAEDAVLNANYVMARLKDDLSASFEGPCMHEALFDDRFLRDTGVTTLDFAKAMIDEGYHPMTMYFPLVVHGAMLVEPTETESKQSLDDFIAAMKRIAHQIRSGAVDAIKDAPRHAPLRRLDETLAARRPVLGYHPPQAAE